MKSRPCFRVANSSSTFGTGYRSNLATGFTVTRKSPRSQMVFLSLATNGVDHSAWATGSITPSATSLAISWVCCRVHLDPSFASSESAQTIAKHLLVSEVLQSCTGHLAPINLAPIKVDYRHPISTKKVLRGVR